MRRTVLGVVMGMAVLVLGGQAAWGCGGLVAPNGAVRLLKTTTLAAYHDGVEHYLTSFQFAGGGSKFGSIIPLPGVPTSVSKGGSWTLQRLEREVNPPIVHAGLASSAAVPERAAQVILQTKVDALDITVLKGGGPAVVAWVKTHGFAVSPDAPAALEFYARRSPIFLAATYDPVAAQSRGLTVGDGTPVQISIPLPNPWVPLRILALGKDSDDVVQADVFLLTDHTPSVLTGPGVSLARSEPASPSLLSDLRSDHGMGWVPDSGWLSYYKVQAPAGQLRYDMAIDASGGGQPSPMATGLLSVRLARTIPSRRWTGWDDAGAGMLAMVVVVFMALARRRSHMLFF